MRWLQRLVVALLGCVVGRALWPESVTLDGPVLFLMSLAVVVVLAPVLLEAEFPGGTRFKFREKLDEAEDAEAAVEQRVSEAAAVSVDLAALRPWDHQPGLITIDDELRSLVSEQPMAAIGVIRADLRQALRALVPRLLPGRAMPLSLEDALSASDQSGKLWPEQMTLIRVLLEAVDHALLTGEADETDANRLIGLVDTLNLSFPIGYSPNFSPNRHWDEQELICEYEHCIENMPLTRHPLALNESLGKRT